MPGVRNEHPTTSRSTVSLLAVLKTYRTACCFVLLSLTGCHGDSPAATSLTDSGAQLAPYVIGPGDKLGIFIYAQPQLSVADLPVRPDGRMSLPLVPDIVAAGRTPSELSEDIADRLKKYVRDPNVSVMVHDFTGPFDRQIRIIGEATEPLAIAYRAHMTLLDVMIMTKGLTKFAAGNSAVIERVGPNGATRSVPVRLADLIKNGDIKQNVDMQPGDTLIIPQSWF